MIPSHLEHHRGAEEEEFTMEGLKPMQRVSGRRGCVGNRSATATANPRQGNGEMKPDPPWAQPQGFGGEDVEEDHPKAPATRRCPGRRWAPVAVELGFATATKGGHERRIDAGEKEQHRANKHRNPSGYNQWGRRRPAGESRSMRWTMLSLARGEPWVCWTVPELVRVGRGGRWQRR